MMVLTVTPVAGFRADIIKASVVAVVAAILLGGTAYVLNRRIGMQVPAVGTLDAYTTKGGLGPSNASDFYYSNQEIRVFAQVKDTSGNPVPDSTLTFKINGPPKSNITLTETAGTNVTGYSVINIVAPSSTWPPEAVLGTWSMIATTEIAGVQITDSLAFEVKAPPSPFIDVYTDRGGVGLTRPSESYRLNETVQLFAKVSNGTHPAASQLVAFTVYNTDGAIVYPTTKMSNASGIAAPDPFTIPIAQPTGTWRIIATVKFEDQVLIDALTFVCLPAS